MFFGLFGQPPVIAKAMAESEIALSEAPAARAEVVSIPNVSIRAGGFSSPATNSIWDGEKFFGGFGLTQILEKDYWTIRKRSTQVNETNMFAAGLIRRLVTAVIVDGMNLEATPLTSLLGLEEGALDAWSKEVENRWGIWAGTSELCDEQEQQTFGALQAQIYSEALLGGDCLVTLQSSGPNGTPRIRMYPGEVVQTPFGQRAEEGNRIVEGVELDAAGRHVAYWVQQSDGSFQRLAARGKRSGKKVAWLVYATPKRSLEVRGTPLLGILLQSLQELDRYRDAALRKAALNAILTLWIEKTAELPGSRALSAGAVRVDSKQGYIKEDAPREFRSAGMIPGLVLEEMQTGEKIHAHGAHGTDEKYGDFEEAMVQAFAWSQEVPPEVLRLSFSSNYSASKAAENNFSVYLIKARALFASQLCQPVYVDWILSEVLAGSIKAPGFLEAWRSPLEYVRFGAWVSCDWCGQVKPSVDPVKTVKAMREAVEQGFMSRRRACREFSGQKFEQVVAENQKANAMLAESLEPLREFLPHIASAAQPEPPQKEAPSEPGADDDEEDAA